MLSRLPVITMGWRISFGALLAEALYVCFHVAVVLSFDECTKTLCKLTRLLPCQSLAH